MKVEIFFWPLQYLSIHTSVDIRSMSKEFSAEEVAKHNKENDCWVIIDGSVYDLTSFLPDHPGGKKAILTFSGRDATEEFDMLHDRKVITKYVPKAKVGVVKKSKL
jgi:cytochrome b involved in lipid metabolism